MRSERGADGYYGEWIIFQGVREGMLVHRKVGMLLGEKNTIEWEAYTQQAPAAFPTTVTDEPLRRNLSLHKSLLAWLIHLAHP